MTKPKTARVDVIIKQMNISINSEQEMINFGL